jgi:Flp pilus assembly protein TadG
MPKKSTFAQFATATSGSVAPTFAVICIPLFGLVAFGIDYGDLVRKKSALQASADFAALAGASAVGDGEAIATAYLASNLARSGLTNALVASSVTTTTQPEGMTVDLTYRQQTYFSSVVGVNTVDISVKSVARKSTGARVLDVAMCIDATGSMQPTIDAVKQNAMTFSNSLNAAFIARNVAPFDAVRVRPIFFRDFGGNAAWYSVSSGGQVDKYPNGFESRAAGDSRNLGDDVPLRAAPAFFNLTNEDADFKSFVDPEVESGGGDYTESGLECINEAIDSPWLNKGETVLTSKGTKTATDVFSVVVLWTDDDVHAPGHSVSLDNANYPDANKMPRSYAGLLAKWRDGSKIPQANKLLATFTRPSAPSTGWQPVMQWDRYMSAGTLSDGTGQLVDRLATVVSTIAGGPTKTRLSQ